jgi:GT2 family glycosyltransferase/spore maturation protein CgeB
MQITILGMHRSGTSVLARLLNMMGAYFAPEGVSTPASEENPKGFWERQDIRMSNDSLLFSKDYDWNRISGFNFEALPVEAIETYNKQIVRTILELDAHRPWVVKEPRLCLLFPLWLPLLEFPVCLHIYRNPVEVALSLKKRNNIPIHTGIALWEKYNLLAFNASTDVPRILISFAEILNDPIKATNRLLNELQAYGLTGLHLPSDKEIQKFISVDLHRNRHDSVKINDFLNPKQIKFYTSLCDRSIFDIHKLTLSSDAEITLEEYDRYQDTTRKLETQQRKQVEQQRKQVEQQRKQAEQLRKQDEQQKKQAERLKKKLTTEQGIVQIHKKKTEKLENELGKIKSRQKKTTNELIALKKRKSVRASLKLAKLVWHTKQMARKPRCFLGPHFHRELSRIKNIRRRASYPRILTEIHNLRPDNKQTEGPLVSIIILTRNGYDHMKRILIALDDNTSYRSFEVIVVDNNSTDKTAELWNATERSFSIQVIHNNHNVSFSKGNNQAANIAKGDYLLFLNNDIKPINSSWLGAMVESLQTEKKRAAAGALLVYPEGTTPAKKIKPQKNLDLTIQHKGIRFVWRNGAPHPVNIGGRKPHSANLLKTRSVPAVTAACMLVKADRFNLINGFDEKYIYGAEDVDICLKLRERGDDIVFVGGAALLHYESATQDSFTNNTKHINRTGNWQFFIERWGSSLHRSLSLDAFQSQRFWSASKIKNIAITVTNNDESAGFGDWYTAHELGSAFENDGWKVTYIERYKDRWLHPPHDTDIIVSLLDSYDPQTAPSHTITVAWIRNWTNRWLERPWFNAYDQIIVSSKISAEVVQQRTKKHIPIIPLGSNVQLFKPNSPDPTYACDFAFTGNNWGPSRSLLTDLTVLKNEKFLLFGKGWKKTPWMARYWRGPLPYKELPGLYSSSKIILDDTASHTLPYGAINSRVFDALACGALVITNNQIGSDEFFDGLLPTYNSPQQLRQVLNKYLNDDTSRKELVAQLQKKVIEQYTYKHICTSFQNAIKQEIEKTKIAIKTCVPRKKGAEFWGDTHFAECLSKALTNEGFRTTTHLMSEWDLPKNQDTDVVIHLRGLHSYTPKPGSFNILWIISHPDDLPIEECESYDLVLVASHLFAKKLATQISVPVHTFLQATDVDLFNPEPIDELLQSDLLFVGNTRNQIRPCVEWAAKLEKDVHIYGKGWNDRNLPAEMIKGEYFPNEQLNRLYSSTKIILNDHWTDMKENGFISNRIFDALACGSFIISDEVPGLEETFNGAVPTFKNKKEFNEIIETFCDEDQIRKELTSKGRDIVLKEHTFASRAQQLKILISDYFLKTDTTREKKTQINISKIQVGCGPHNIKDDWHNVDIRPFDGVDSVMDVTKTWPFQDLSYVYGEHFLEHLTLDNTIKFLSYAGNALKRGGVMRLTTPNLEWVHYTHFDPHQIDKSKKIHQVLKFNRAFYGWGHQFLYSPDFLKCLLEKMGFVDMAFCSYGKSKHTALQDIEQHEGYSSSGGFKNLIIIEATKGKQPITLSQEFNDIINQHFLRHVAAGH